MSDSEKTISVKLNEKWIARLDKLAQKADISRHQLMRNMIEVGIDGINLASKVGFFQVGLKIRDLLGLRAKPEPGEEKPLPLKLDENLLAKIDTFAERGNLSRHQLMRNLIQIGIEEMEGLSRVGILKISIALRDIEDAVKKIIRDGQRATDAVQKNSEGKEVKSNE